MRNQNEITKYQVNLRSSDFDSSAQWVRDPRLIAAHLKMAGPANKGKAAELCCGTGLIARGLHAAGWDITGIDISEGMIGEARKHIPAYVGDVVDLPFNSQSLELVVMRHAYFLLDNGPAALREIRRVLKPNGRFILSHVVPFSHVDEEHLKKVHTLSQAKGRKFHTVETLSEDLQGAEFKIVDKEFVVVRESVSMWMSEASDLSEAVRQDVCRLVAEAPEDYRNLRGVKVTRGEILEDWNFVLLQAIPGLDS